MNSVREARAAVRAAQATGLPVLVSFVVLTRRHAALGRAARRRARGGRALVRAALLVNCLPRRTRRGASRVLAASGRPFAVYANLGAPDA